MKPATITIPFVGKSTMTLRIPDDDRDEAMTMLEELSPTLATLIRQALGHLDCAESKRRP